MGSWGADDPARSRRPTGHCAPERIFAMVARARGGGAADAGGSRDRLRPLQPPGQGLPHGYHQRVQMKPHVILHMASRIDGRIVPQHWLKDLAAAVSEIYERGDQNSEAMH